jgi:hypothetical protein
MVALAMLTKLTKHEPTLYHTVKMGINVGIYALLETEEDLFHDLISMI